MHITRKSMYAIKALIYIASQDREKLCTISEISEEEKIPREYMAKILKELSDKGFLSSYRGIQGGYKLKKSISDISFLDILESMQGAFFTNLEESSNNEIYKGAAYRFWSELHGIVADKLANMSLEKVNNMPQYRNEDTPE